jgi:hypothetical protein
MSLAMYAAPFNDNDELKNNDNEYINKKKQAHNKTQKKYSKENFDTDKVNNVLQQIHDNSTDEETGLGDFNPPPNPESIGAQRKKLEQNNIEKMSGMSNNYENNIQVLGKSPDPTYQSRTNDHLDLNNFISNYGDNNNAEEYYKKMLPGYVNNPHNRQYYNSSQTQTQTQTQKQNEASPNYNMSINNDLLLQKINYMINLLEEQQDEKTNNVTEEVVLYSFLGIFIIFVVDSFAKVGKYVR